jgi:NAD(P)-dependent dehydrogenase (short-subunit alcohol dehydrogenase family)
LFVREGALLHVVDVSEKRLVDAAKALGGAVSATIADVTDKTAIAAAVAAAVDRFGGLDVLISNAGISGPAGSIADVPLSEFERVLKVLVMGAATVLQCALPAVVDGGSVIITSSVAGFIGTPNMSAYSTAKHAQVGLMRSVAREVAHRRIRVNTMHPGPVDNEFQADVERRATGLGTDEARAAFDQRIPLGRHATVDEIAQGMAYLASDASAMVTSTTFRIDGGLVN